MKIGSLFSGYGGLDLAVQAVFPDAHPAWFVEYDEAPSKILAHHYPGVPNYGDVTTCDWATMPPIDILTGGFPCQPFSQAGARAGENDERHLWPYVLEAIRALKPKITILENVSGLRSIGANFEQPTFTCICGWSGRRGRLHYSEIHQESERDGHPRTDRNVNQSPISAEEDAAELRRNFDNAGTVKPNALENHNLDGDRSRSSSIPNQDPGSLDSQIGAGASGVKDRGNQNVTRTDRNSRPLPLDAGKHRSMQDALPQAERVERTWAGEIGDNGAAFCPACSRELGNESDGLVFRSGLGTVYRDLASLGLHARWTSLRVSELGGAHHRERLFILVTDPSCVGLQAGGQPIAGAPEVTRTNSSVSPFSDSESGGRDHGQATHHRPTNREKHPLGHDCDTATNTGCEHGRPGSGDIDGAPATIGAPTANQTQRHTSSLADTANNGRKRPGQARCGRNGPQNCHNHTTDWGKYTEAIRSWERAIGVPAPDPTEPNSKGKPRLAAEFAEWMMGLPSGWVTSPGIGLSRAQQLKAIGNGVCPQQGATAIQQLLGGPDDRR